MDPIKTGGLNWKLKGLNVYKNKHEGNLFLRKSLNGHMFFFFRIWVVIMFGNQKPHPSGRDDQLCHPYGDGQNESI